MNNIKQNLTILLAAVEAQPETLFNLDRYKADEPCGTIFCTLGLGCSMPYFIEKGFGFIEETLYGGGKLYYASLDGAHVLEVPDALDKVFGESAWQRLFAPAGCGNIDGEVGYDDESVVVGEGAWGDPVCKPNMTDKELAIARLKYQIKLYSDE